MRIALLLCVPALMLGGARLAAQGRLDDIRDEVRQPSLAAPSSSSSNEKCGSSCDSDGCNPFESFLGVFGYVAIALIAEANEGTRFAPYPYWDNWPGLMWVPPRDKDGYKEMSPLDVPLKHTSWRLQIENGNDFTGMNRLGGQVQVDTSCGLGLRLGYQWLNERLWCGCYDNLGLGDANVMVRLIPHERLQMHVGLGVVWLSDPRRTDAGLNATASVDLFLVKPLVFSTQFDVGSIGSAITTHVRGTLGYQWKRWELFLGYDHRRIGSVNVQGPLAGVRVWF